MLRTQTQALAENFKIPMEHLKWYGAFHNESHHPHVHLMVYADEGIKPYLSKQGVMNLRSSQQRNALRQQSRELIAEIVSKINAGSYENPKLEEKNDEKDKNGGAALQTVPKNRRTPLSQPPKNTEVTSDRQT